MLSILPDGLQRPRLAVDLRKGYAWFLEAQKLRARSGTLNVADLRTLVTLAPTDNGSVAAFAANRALHGAFFGFRQASRLRATAIVVAAIDHRQRHGGWPDSAAVLPLESATLLEAGSSTPLTLEFTKDEVVVRGVGVDMDNDGGRPVDDGSDIAESSFPQPYDVVLDGDLVVRVRMPRNAASVPLR